MMSFSESGKLNDRWIGTQCDEVTTNYEIYQLYQTPNVSRRQLDCYFRVTFPKTNAE